MKTVFDELKQRIRDLEDTMPSILEASIREAAPVIEDKVIEQLKRGERGDGQMLPDYSPTSVNVYGKRPGPMTLEDTGDYHRRHRVVVDDQGFEITNDDWKAPKLAMTYGEEIIELQDQSFEELKPEILDDVIHDNIEKFFNDNPQL